MAEYESILLNLQATDNPHTFDFGAGIPLSRFDSTRIAIRSISFPYSFVNLTNAWWEYTTDGGATWVEDHITGSFSVATLAAYIATVCENESLKVEDALDGVNNVFELQIDASLLKVRMVVRGGSDYSLDLGAGESNSLGAVLGFNDGNRILTGIDGDIATQLGDSIPNISADQEAVMVVTDALSAGSYTMKTDGSIANNVLGVFPLVVPPGATQSTILDRPTYLPAFTARSNVHRITIDMTDTTATTLDFRGEKWLISLEIVGRLKRSPIVDRAQG